MTAVNVYWLLRNSLEVSASQVFFRLLTPALRGHRAAGANPSCLRVKAGLDPRPEKSAELTAM